MSNLLKSSVLYTPTVGVAPIPVQSPHRDVPIANEFATQDVVLNGPSIQEQYTEFLLFCERQKEETNRHCEQLLQEAGQAAERIQTDARNEGYAAGYDAGYEFGVREGQQRYVVEMDRLRAAMLSLDSERERLFHGTADILTNITMAAVQNLLQRELTSSAANVSVLVESLLQYVVEGTRVQIRISPQDLQSLRETIPRWQGMKFGEWDISVVPDEMVFPGGCVVRSDVGRIDATIETRLELLKETLQEVMERSVKNDVLANP